jgi:hypothetical protein
MSFLTPISVRLNKFERIQSLKNAFGSIKASLTGHWEGYQRDRYRDRPGVEFRSQEGSLNFGTREKQISEARVLCQTFPLCSHIIHSFQKYVVGSCIAEWNTGDKKIDEAYKANWIDWQNSKNCDVRRQYSFKLMTRLALKHTIMDGDIFAQKVKSNLGSRNYAQLAMIEPDRVTNNAAGLSLLLETNRGGIEIDKNTGAPLSIKVWDRMLYGLFQNMRQLPIEDVFHMRRPDRVDSYRGLTWFYNLLDDIRDVKETKDAEKASVKVNSQFAVIVRNALAKPASTLNMWNDLPVSTKARMEYDNGGNGSVKVSQLQNGAFEYQAQGDSFDAHTSARPSPAWMGFMEFMIREIALGFNLPYGVVWSMAGLPGPGVRFEINSAGRTFSDAMEMIEDNWLIPICLWKTALDIEQGRIPFTPNWYKFEFPRPPFITIDFGRDSAARINELKMGMGNYTDWYAENSQHFKEQAFKRGEEMAIWHDVQKQYAARGVIMDDLVMMKPNGEMPIEPDSDDSNDKPSKDGVKIPIRQRVESKD